MTSGIAVAAALIFGLALGCTHDPGGRSGGSPDPGSAADNFPNPLMGVLTKLVANDIPAKSGAESYLAVKYSLLSNALANLDFQRAGSTKVIELSQSDKDVYVPKGNQPPYFANAFSKNNIRVDAIDGDHGRYDYGKDGETWVDYAAVNLGGGVFHNGFAQEETMALEMPELADRVAKGGQYTRGQGCKDPNKPRPLECSPTPLFIGPVHRTMKIDPSLTPKGNKDFWKAQPVNTLFKYMTPLPKNVELNVLAVAVASLEGLTNQEAAQPTINDLFNTLVAAFQLAKGKGVTTLNTGGIGTGVFENSPKVVYAMQRLAATHVGINLRYYGLGKDAQGKDEKKTWDPIVDQIIADYGKSGTQTIKHLLEIAHDALK
jgi:hypothetical protein